MISLTYSFLTPAIVGGRVRKLKRVTAIRLGINEADSAAASPGDILCCYQDALVLAAEVKDRALEIHDIETAIGKAPASWCDRNLVHHQNTTRGRATNRREDGKGIRLGDKCLSVSIDTLLQVALSIAGEASRVLFLTLAGEELNDRVTQPSHKLAHNWQELLQNL